MAATLLSSGSPMPEHKAAGSDSVVTDDGRWPPHKSIDVDDSVAVPSSVSPAPDCKAAGSNNLAADEGQRSPVKSLDTHEVLVFPFSASLTPEGEAAGSDNLAADEGRRKLEKLNDTEDVVAVPSLVTPTPEQQSAGSKLLTAEAGDRLLNRPIHTHDAELIPFSVPPMPETEAVGSESSAAEEERRSPDKSMDTDNSVAVSSSVPSTPELEAAGSSNLAMGQIEEINEAIVEVLAEDAAQEMLAEDAAQDAADAEPPLPDPRAEDDDDLPARPLSAAQPVLGLSAGRAATVQEEWQGPAEHERAHAPSRALVLGTACRPGPGRPFQISQPGQLGRASPLGVSSIDEDSAAPADEGFGLFDGGLAAHLPLPLPCVPRPSPLGAPGGALTAPSPSASAPSPGAPQVATFRRGGSHSGGHALIARRRPRAGSGPRAGNLGQDDAGDDFFADDPPVCPDENSPLVERIRPLQHVQPTPALGVPLRFRRHGSAPPPGVDARGRTDGGGWCGSVALERRCNYSPSGFPRPPRSSSHAFGAHGPGAGAVGAGASASSSSRDTNHHLSPLHLAQPEDGEGDVGWCGSVATERSDGPRPPLTGPRTLLGGGGGSSLVVTASGGVEPSAPDSARGLRLQSVKHELRVAMQSLVACDVQLCAHLVDRARGDADVRARRDAASLRGRLAESRADAARLRRDLQRLKGSRQELNSMPTGTLHALQQELSTALQNVNEELEARTKCCVCREVERQVVLQPCRHLALCSGCARRVTRCPLCRRDIERFEAVSVA